MKARLVVDDLSFRKVQLGLRNLGNLVPENARKTMRRAAERIVKKAKLYAPEDTGALTESIRIEAVYGVRGRLEIKVVVGGDQQVYVGAHAVNLDQYAAIIHEHYEDILWGEGGKGPSDKTRAKMAANPGKVGSGFLRTAFEEEGALINRDMIVGITEIIKKEGMQ